MSSVFFLNPISSVVNFTMCLSASQLNRKVKVLAERIGKETWPNKELYVLVILNGAFVFAADLVRELSKYHLSIHVEFCKVKSYLFTQKSNLETILKIPQSLKGKNVLIVDTIEDSGTTLQWCQKELESLGCSKVRTVVLITKKLTKDEHTDTNWYGFSLDKDTFYVGYGLDFRGKHRELPDIYSIAENKNSKN